MQMVQNNILKRVGVHLDYWEMSMDKYFPQGEVFARRFIRFSLSSPVIHDTRKGKSEEEIGKIYVDATNFAIKVLNEKREMKKDAQQNDG